MGRIESEKKVMHNMIKLYCSQMHRTKTLCESCNQLYEYSTERLNKFPFKDAKPACANCLIHCYKPQMREKIRDVMRFSGPRMVFYYPKDFFIHILQKAQKHNSEKSK